MDGRLLLICLAMGSLMSAGCRSSNKTPVGAPVPPVASRPMMPVDPTDSKDNKGPLKSETVALFADLQVDATFNEEDITPQERDRRIDAARRKYQEVLQKDPKNYEALRGLGRLYTRLGDRDRAAQIYQAALAAHPRNHGLAHEAALSYGRFDNWDMALKMWQHALSLDPESRKYPRMLGLAQARLGNYEAGFSTMMKVCSEAEARTVMARELLEAGQTAAGQQQLTLACQADPNYAPAQQLAQQLAQALGNQIQQAGFQQ